MCSVLFDNPLLHFVSVGAPYNLDHDMLVTWHVGLCLAVCSVVTFPFCGQRRVRQQFKDVLSTSPTFTVPNHTAALLIHAYCYLLILFFIMKTLSLLTLVYKTHV